MKSLAITVELSVSSRTSVKALATATAFAAANTHLQTLYHPQSIARSVSLNFPLRKELKFPLIIKEEAS